MEIFGIICAVLICIAAGGYGLLYLLAIEMGMPR